MVIHSVFSVDKVYLEERHFLSLTEVDEDCFIEEKKKKSIAESDKYIKNFIYVLHRFDFVVTSTTFFVTTVELLIVIDGGF